MCHCSVVITLSYVSCQLDQTLALSALNSQVTFFLEIFEMLRMLTRSDRNLTQLHYYFKWGLKDIYNTVKTNKDGGAGAAIRGCKLPTNMVIILMSVDFKISILGVGDSGR